MERINIGFADLTHTGKGYSSIMFPLGISYVGAYAQKEFGNQIEVELFKYPDNLKKYLEEKPPKVMCFSDSYWTHNLSINIAKKIKDKYPKTIIIFGGPNYPRSTNDQKKFFKDSPVDFYIYREGELAFVEILKKLIKYDFDVKSIYNERIKIPNCHYIFNNELVRGENLPKILNLDDVPSPYLVGLMDKFFDDILTPAIQTTRGCPFQCSFCQESSIYFTKVSRWSPSRIKEELEYIAQRTKVPELQMADSNFGMYDIDLETSRLIAEIRKIYNYPKYINVGTGKNRKDLTIEVASILEGALLLGAAVQSTDPAVLKNIKRQNVILDHLIEIAKAGKRFGANTFSEVILCLPGDTLSAHLKSMCDMVDLGINVVRSHQLIMLPDTELYTEEYREKYEMVTKFRVYPRCFGKYEFFSESFSAFEIEEICIQNNTMSFGDYMECRKFDLTVEIFYNSGVFYELFQFLKQKDINTSHLLKKLHDKVCVDSELSDLYEGFLKVGKDNTWDTKEEIEGFLKKPGIYEKYASGELGNNEQLNCRAMAFFKRMGSLHKFIYVVAKKILMEKNRLNEKDIAYLDELQEFSLLRKQDLLSLEQNTTKTFHFNFIKMVSSKFEPDPYSLMVKEGINVQIKHSQSQKDIIRGYLKQYGNSLDGLGLFLSRCHVNKIYREIINVGDKIIQNKSN